MVSRNDAPRHQLRLLGPFQLRVEGRAVVVPHGAARVVAMLAILGPSARTNAVRVLWPDAEPRHGLANLRSALTRVSAAAAGLLEEDGKILAVDPQVRTDVDDATGWVNSVLYDAPPAHVGAPPASAGRELLQGWDDPWLDTPRVRLRLLQSQALEMTAERLLGAGRPAEALPYALAAAESQPWSESANRLVIEIYARRGDRSSSLRWYRRFQAALEDELGIQAGADLLSGLPPMYTIGLTGPVPRTRPGSSAGDTQR